MANREIKFRAWDIVKKKMCNKLTIDYCNEYGFNNAYHEDDSGFGDIPILMQFTGLKDKNEKEIYEGDIVKTRWIEDDKIYTGKVIFKDGCFRLYVERFFVPVFDSEYSSYIRELEILGNIYENPELFAKKQNPEVKR